MVAMGIGLKILLDAYNICYATLKNNNCGGYNCTNLTHMDLEVYRAWEPSISLTPPITNLAAEGKTHRNSGSERIQAFTRQWVISMKSDTGLWDTEI